MSGEPVLVEDCEDLIKDYPVRVWGELPSSAIVVPLSVGHQATPSLVLIIGLSCRLRFDEDYELFIVSSILPSSVDFLLTIQQRLRNRIFEGYTTARTYQADALRIEDSEALDRAKNMLFTNVAYQLFTPLSLIAGPIDDMLVDMPSSSEKDGLMMARRHV
jgi:hypothetical protein